MDTEITVTGERRISFLRQFGDHKVEYVRDDEINQPSGDDRPKDSPIKCLPRPHRAQLYTPLIAWRDGSSTVSFSPRQS